MLETARVGGILRRFRIAGDIFVYSARDFVWRRRGRNHVVPGPSAKGGWCMTDREEAAELLGIAERKLRALRATQDSEEFAGQVRGGGKSL